jgi:hypothetical protein
MMQFILNSLDSIILFIALLLTGGTFKYALNEHYGFLGFLEAENHKQQIFIINQDRDSGINDEGDYDETKDKTISLANQFDNDGNIPFYQQDWFIKLYHIILCLTWSYFYYLTH